MGSQFELVLPSEVIFKRVKEEKAGKLVSFGEDLLVAGVGVGVGQVVEEAG